MQRSIAGLVGGVVLVMFLPLRLSLSRPAGLLASQALAEECNKEFLMQQKEDKTQTHLQKLKSAEERCKGKDISTAGSVEDVDSERSFIIRGNDGLKYHVFLIPSHQCGDLVRIRKGQTLSVRGKILAAYYHEQEMFIDNATCVTENSKGADASASITPEAAASPTIGSTKNPSTETGSSETSPRLVPAPESGSSVAENPAATPVAAQSPGTQNVRRSDDVVRAGSMTQAQQEAVWDCSGFLGTWEVRGCNKTRTSRTSVGIDYWVVQEASKTIAKGYWQSGARSDFQRPLTITCTGSAPPVVTGGNNVNDQPMQLTMIDGHAYGQVPFDFQTFSTVYRFDAQKVSYKPLFSFDLHIYEDDSVCAPPAEVAAPSPPPSEDDHAAVPYEIVQAENTSHMAITKRVSELTARDFAEAITDKRMRYRAVVPHTIKQEQVGPTFRKIVDAITLKDPDIDEMTIEMYSDRELVVADSADVARATWAPGGELGNVTPEIARTNNRAGYELKVDWMRPDLEAYLRTRNTSETKFGLSDDERKHIYREIVEAEDRADREAPLPGIERNQRLQEEYRDEVAARHHLSKEIMSAIAAEGLKKNWPLPPTSNE